jgi:rhodanese-related sulfurtransferase
VHELSAIANPDVVDVREPDEFARGHVPGAVNIPMSQFLERISEIPDADSVYVICAVGGRSAQAVAYLRSIDIPAVDVLGGTMAWQFAGLPMQHPPG